MPTHHIILANTESLNSNGVITETDYEDSDIEIEDGVTKPIYPIEEAIVERVYVDSKVDTDGDGKNDKIAIDVLRPHTEDGVKVPVIYEMSPYRGGTNPVTVHELDRELYAVEEDEQNEQGFFNSATISDTELSANLGTYGNYYVPRGYAVVLGYSLGNGPSDGCPTIGDMKEILATTSVIDWLNGRAKGYTEDGEEVEADWSTGNVGMIGLSFNGALANGAAITGIEGLKTIIPGGAISSWYDYSRSYGAIQAQQGWDLDILANYVLTRDNPEVCTDVIENISEQIDRKTADYNDFWDERNYLKEAHNIEASVLLVHGLLDWNVKPKQFGQWWDALKENNVTRKMFLHQGGHSMPRSEEFQELQHKWFDYWLYGIENNIMDEPAVTVQREDRSYTQQETWPHSDTKETKLYFKAGENNASGTLSTKPSTKKIVESFADDAFIPATQLVSNIEQTHENRLAYLSEELTEDVLFSGTPTVKIRASIDQPVTNLTALLVDFDGEESKIITRGWMDPQNYESISYSKPIIPNEEYTFEWGLQPNDYVFKTGHRIGIVIMQSDNEYTIRPKAGTKLNFSLNESEVTLPLVGHIESVDKTGLEDRVDEINREDLNEEDYTESSWNALQRALTAANHVLEDTEATQSIVDESLATLNEAYEQLEKADPINTRSMITRVERFAEEEAFASDQIVHALTLHLTAVSHYEQTEQAEKVVKHMKGLKLLLEHQYENGDIIEEAYKTLDSDADALINQWQ